MKYEETNLWDIDLHDEASSLIEKIEDGRISYRGLVKRMKRASWEREGKSFFCELEFRNGDEIIPVEITPSR
jgi:hypothetical protein